MVRAMTTIPNLNVVIQQGGSARDAQNVRNQPQYTNSNVENQVPDKIQAQRTTVLENEQPEEAKLHKDKNEESRAGKRQRKRIAAKKKKKMKKAAKNENYDGTGRFLDTVV